MDQGIADLNLNDGEEDAFSLLVDSEEQNVMYNFCLVGCYLTASVVHFPAMRNTMANIWHPLEGVQISDLGEKHFLFKFFNKMDISRIISGTHWTFNNHLLIFHRLVEGEDPMSVPLVFANRWIQVHDLPLGFFRDSMAVQFENFIGRFLEYDMKQLSNGLQYGIQELEMGWDLSLGAQGRKASIVNSIWFRGEGEHNFFGKSRFGQFSSQQSSQNKGKESGGNFNFLFGINLEGSKFPAVLNEYQQGNNFNHNGDKDLERGKSQISGLALYGDV
ncbi:hypothetical protein CXB51_015974 [Gossypium anomalum]|uniref:DUF4283 domain-containing protein n=1 Tax=Gossypium anomalum TaxID=47600 RepID=A0A8J5YVL9_9ROSI|nr:hypothetical protein CXB51_015974 [Gossypium anomalum]